MIASLTFGEHPLPGFLFPLALLAAWLTGSIPFGFFAGRIKGIDIRDHGSGNIGATNVLRVIGKPWGFTVFCLDVLKGLVPVLACRWVAPQEAPWSFLPIAAAVAAILGHNYTPWLRFRGGKGIATSAGAFAGLSPVAVAVAVLAWLAIFALTRYVAVASIVGAIMLSLTVGVLCLLDPGTSPALLGLSLLVTFLAVWRHRSNIARLRAGTENRFGRPQKTPCATTTAPTSSPPSSTSHD
ncbi:MAG TPA: glycerol-3-phosphate 1-O-acyltransferase PlsY [Verrucomicrobiales bacterium]|nr:glycerol-3-phosphate 1-O-acyltransferase PlsY [Verrucomicrobiales bacterium]